MKKRKREGKTPRESVRSWRGICLLSVDLIKSDSLVSPSVGGGGMGGAAGLERAEKRSGGGMK